MGIETGLIALAVFALAVIILLVKMASAKPYSKHRRRGREGLVDKLSDVVPDMDD